MSSTTHAKVLYLVQLALLLAVLIVMSVTPLGYLKTAGLEISFLMIPVTLGAILLGPAAGAFLGLVFGLTSFLTCLGLLNPSAFGAALLAIHPVGTAVVCILPRIIAGLVSGLIFRAMYRPSGSAGLRGASYVLSSLSGPVLNTVGFVGLLVVFFYHTPFIQEIASGMGAANPLVFAMLFVGIQAVVEAVVCCVICTVLARVLCPLLRRAA